MANNLTTDEQNKGYLQVGSDIVDPTNNSNGQATVVRRYVDPASTPTPTTNSSPYANGQDTSGGLSPGYSMVNGQLTYNGSSNPTQTTQDPLASYYNNLADPSVADQPLKDQIQKNMNDALSAIDQKYVGIYADKLGQTKAINARSGTSGSDFGNAAVDNTQTSVDNAKSAEKNAVTIDYTGQLNNLASSEIAARKADALGKATEAQAQFDKNKTDAQNLIVSAAKSGQTLTDGQKQVLMRNAGYDQLTFDSVFNANKTVPEYSNFQQLKDGSLVGFDKQGNMKNYGKYDLPADSTFVFAPDGTPFVFDKTTGKAEIAAGFKQGQFAKPDTSNSTGGGLAGPYVKGANPAVDNWVALYNQGKAKLADVPNNLLNSVVAGVASTGGNAGNDILTTTKQSIQDLNDMVTKDQGFSGAVGAKGISSLFGLKGSPIAGTAAADFDGKLNQVVNDVVLPNLTLLHGLGRVTDREFLALKSSLTSLSPNLSEGEFKSELKKVTDTINSKTQDSGSGTNISVQAPDGNTYNFPDQASADNFKKQAGIK